MTTQVTGTLEEWLAARIKSVKKDEVAVSQPPRLHDNLARWVFFFEPRCDRDAHAFRPSIG